MPSLAFGIAYFTFYPFQKEKDKDKVQGVEFQPILALCRNRLPFAFLYVCNQRPCFLFLFFFFFFFWVCRSLAILDNSWCFVYILFWSVFLV